MAAILIPCFSNRAFAFCSSTSCPLQYGHQSAERKKRRTVPFGPFKVSRVCSRPNWSRSEKAGAFWPTASPIAASGFTDAFRIVLPSSAPETVTLSPNRPAAWSGGSRLYNCLEVSSYSIFAPVASLSVHLGNSAKASSEVQFALMMIPDHGPEFGWLFWPFRERPAANRSTRAGNNGRFAILHSPWRDFEVAMTCCFLHPNIRRAAFACNSRFSGTPRASSQEDV